MKRTLLMTLLLALGLILAQNSLAMNGHGDHGGAKHIRHTIVDGYTLAYQLIDMKANAEKQGLTIPPEMKSHHLMIHIKDDSGKVVSGAKVGFLVDNEGGQPQKVMAMAMGGGYGGDIDLEPGADYVIKAKVVAGDVKLMDEFEYSLN